MTVVQMLQAVIAPFRPAASEPLHAMSDATLAEHVEACERHIQEGEATLASASTQLADDAAESYAEGEPKLAPANAKAVEKARMSLETLRVTVVGLRNEQERRRAANARAALVEWRETVAGRGVALVGAMERWREWAEECPILEAMAAWSAYREAAQGMPASDEVLKSVINHKVLEKAWDDTGLSAWGRGLLPELMRELFAATDGLFGTTGAIGTTVSTFLETRKPLAGRMQVDVDLYQKNIAHLGAVSLTAKAD